MAKKPGPVAGSLGDTTYYYKSDGTVVDENGVPASARISAMYSAPPPVEEAAAVRAPKRKKKNNAQIAGILSNTKYFYAPDGTILDDQGRPAPDKIAAYFPAHEKREAIAEAMPKAPGIKTAAKATGVPSKVIKQFNRNISIATNLITTNQKIMETYPKLFEQMSGVVQKMTEQNETVIRTMIQNNQEFQDKVIETLTGVKAPTQAGGSVAPKPGRKGAGRKSLKASRAAAVTSRAKGIKQAKAGGMSTGAAIGLAAAGAAAVGVGAAIINNAGSGGPPAGPLVNSGLTYSNVNPSAQAIGTKLAQNLMSDFGLTKEQAAGVTGHFGHESGFRPGINEQNPLIPGSRGGYGLAQWTGPRRRALEAFSIEKKQPVDSFELQYEFLKHELNSNAGYKRILDNVKKTTTVEAAMQAFYPFESGGDARAISAFPSRIKWANSVSKWLGAAPAQTADAQQTAPAAPPPAGGPERRPSATPEEAAMHQTNVGMLQNLNNLAARKGPGGRLGEANEAKKKELEEKIAAFNQKFSLRPIQQAGTVTPLVPGSQPGQPVQAGTVRPLDTTGAGPIGDLSNILPSGNIVALGKALQGMGINVSEHPAFGPVGQHAPGSAHYSGRAIDVNGPPGMVEANDPVWGPKFDRLAESMRAAGYKVIWRSAGHFNHLHAQISAGGDTTPVPGAPAPDYYAGGNNNRVGAASQSYAMDRNAAACACPPTIINNTMINDNIRTIMQPSVSQITRHNFGTPFNQSAFAAGAAIGGLLRRLF